VVVHAEQQALVRGLRLERVLGRGAHNVVWAASSSDDSAPWGKQRALVVKLALDAGAGHGPMLRREARALARLHHPHIVRLWQVGSTEDGRDYLVLDAAEGSLADELRKGPLGIARTLSVAGAVARALDACHRKGVVHRDVKPSNLLLAHDRTVWLGDFGLSLDLSLAELGGARVAGSLLYAAPEQTGMLRREVDGRADLYALGVVLFECLTGHPPFQGDEAEALLQLHAAARPPDVRVLRQDVPEPLARLIAKLLSKDPDDRHATALSLLADLDELTSGGELAQLGTKHTRRQELEPSPFGREREVEEIRHAVAKLRSGRGGTLCVTGGEGAGKTRVCDAALAPLRSLRVLSTRATDADGTSFAQFRSLVAQLLALAAEPDGEPLVEIVARHGSALARLFPDLPGLGAPKEGLSADLAIEALVRALGECGTVGQPCVILFEAADRLSATDHGVLRRLHMQAQTVPLLLLCTGESKPFADVEHAVPEVHLAPLDPLAVEQLLRHVLGPLPLSTRLPGLALSCSGGNPAALLGLLGKALSEGVIDTDGTSWLVDDARLLSLASDAATRSFDALLQGLDAGVLEVLRHAALFGRRFAPHWLELVGHLSQRASEALWEGTQRRLLVSTDGDVVFAHVSIREALAAQVSDEERERVLARLMVGLEARATLTRDERALLGRAHFAVARADTARRAWERCLEAGLSELEAFAFVEARTLLDGAALLAERFAIEPDFRLHRARAQLDAQAGSVDEAVGKFRLAIDSCPDGVERAMMHLRCAELRFFHEAGHAAPMREHLVLAHRELGGAMPVPGPWSFPKALFFALVAVCMELFGIRLGADVSPRARAQARLYELTGMYFFWTQHKTETLRVCMEGWIFKQRIGECRELIHAIAGLANLFLIIGLKRGSERYFNEAYRVAERIGDGGAQAYVRYMQGIGASLTADAQRGERILAQQVDVHGGELDIAYLGQAAANLAAAYNVRGDVRRAEQVLDRVKAQVESRFGEEAELPETCLAAYIEVLMQTGRVERARPFLEHMNRRLSDPITDPLGWQMRYNATAVYEYTRGSSDEVIDRCVEEANKAERKCNEVTWLVSQIWVKVAYVRLAQWLRAAPADKPRRVQLFCASVQPALAAPRDPYIKAHVHVLLAARHWMHGRLGAAERELVHAEREALACDGPRALVEARALRARMLLDRGHDAQARYEARAATALADACGLTTRAREVERAFSVTVSSGTLASDGPSHRATQLVASSAQRERDALLEVTVAASHELEPRAQAAIVLDRLIALLGAERGLIFADADDGALERLAGRSAARADLAPDVVYAQSLVRRVRQTSVPLVLSGTEEGAGLGSESMVAGNLRSMVCAPIRLGDQTRGVIYLDSSLARGVFTRRDLDILTAMGSQIALTQEMARGARMQVERLALQKDLQLSGAVQTLFLPKEQEVVLSDLSIAAAYVPVSHSGGDYWSYEKRPDGRCWLLVADATGHGAGAAMVTAVLAGSYRSLVDRGATSLAEVLGDLHRTMAGVFGGRHAATVTALELVPDQRRVKVWSAGGPPLLLRGAMGDVDSHVVRGTPLGTATWVLGELELALEPGARLLIVTDGVLEMPTTSGRELGARRLRKMLAEHGGHDVAAARAALMTAILTERGNLEADDDLTLLVVGRS
jgi:serine phosphatase RsbU (regulator of sigma subunit)/tetratricopeptide (TPR) repeat protein